MAVYVDALVYHDNLPPRLRRLGNEWCHLSADTLEELHEFADRLGLKRSWFQNKRLLPHYDLVPVKRAMAVELGAVEVTARWFVYSCPLSAWYDPSRAVPPKAPVT